MHVATERTRKVIRTGGVSAPRVLKHRGAGTEGISFDA
jgi:hypothetical protein